MPPTANGLEPACGEHVDARAGGAGEVPWIGLEVPAVPPPMAPLRALVVGCGYSGGRFARVVRYLERQQPGWITLAGLCDALPARARALDARLPAYPDVPTALAECRPDVVIVSVNEVAHGEVLAAIGGCAARLVLCEKPLTSTLDEALRVSRVLGERALYLNLVERFSPLVAEARRWLAARQLRTLRVEFFWGKHRIGDPRRSMGVLSEMVHPLDMTDHLFGIERLRVREITGLRSNYAPGQGRQLDTVDLVADAGGFPLVGHSSFTWPRRTRVVTALLEEAGGRLYRLTLDFDVGEWDCDDLSVVEIDQRSGEVRPVHQARVANHSFPAELHGIYKVCRFLQAGMHASHGVPDPGAPADLAQALRLQHWLHDLLGDLDRRDVPTGDVRAASSEAYR